MIDGWIKLSLADVASLYDLAEMRMYVDYDNGGGSTLRVFPVDDDEMLVRLPSGEFYRGPGWMFVKDALDAGYQIRASGVTHLQSTSVRHT